MDAKNDILKALESLKAEQERIGKAVESLEMLLEDVRPPLVTEKPKRKSNGPRAPRGYLKDRVTRVLTRMKNPFPVVELKKRLVEEGYEYGNGQSLYASIFALTKRDPDFIVEESGVMLARKETEKPKRKPRKKKESPALPENTVRDNDQTEESSQNNVDQPEPPFVATA